MAIEFNPFLVRPQFQGIALTTIDDAFKAKLDKYTVNNFTLHCMGETAGLMEVKEGITTVATHGDMEDCTLNMLAKHSFKPEIRKAAQIVLDFDYRKYPRA